MRTDTGGGALGKAMAAIVLAVLVLAGCAEKESKKDPFFEEWRSRAEQSRGHSPSSSPAKVPAPAVVPRKLSHALVDTPAATAATPAQVPEPIQVAGPALPTPKISLKVQDLAVTTLLRVLARAAEQNILISENVKGTATVSVNDMPWDKVFLGILKTNGLTYAWEGDIIRIITLEDLDRETKLAEALQKKEAREKEFELRMSSLQTRASLAEPLQTWVYHVKYADTQTLRDNLDRFFRASRAGSDGSGQEKAASKIRGAVLVDTHTNSLVVQAIKNDIDWLKETVALLDVPTKQVLIEAFIVQATDEVARDLGIQWGGGFTTSDGSLDHYVTAGANSSGGLGSDLATAVAATTGNVVNFPATTGDSGFTLGYISQNIGQHLLSVQLSALETDGKLNILSNPSITTLDNQKAIIESGRDIPYQTVEDQNVQIEYKKAVLSLEVVPYVVDERTLKLKINTKKDEPDFSNEVSGQPTIITRKAETSVVLFDGETTVIGGLSEKKIEDGEAGVPWLKNIPGLGHLFKNTTTGNSMDELLIFITPHILKQRPDVAASGKIPES